jgi:pyruvate kinase
MHRRTKIVCTLGPTSSNRETIAELIRAGMDVARLNFSHGTHEEHARLIRYVREAAADQGRVVPILQDLQGPKIRIGPIKNGGVLIHKGQPLTLTTEPIEYGTRERVQISYQTLAEDVDVGGRILLDDGLLELVVTEIVDGDVVTEVTVGGPLRSRKGVNLPDIKTSSPSLTMKDLEDLEFGLAMDVDLIALSFVRDESDVTDLMGRVRASGKRVMVIAKIEKPEAVRRIDEILDEADAIMVARGDLGIEMPISRVPSTQKTIIHKCMAAAKPVITATQMLESMIDNPRPTRAEASDVANAVLDGSDAVMLSGETAVGKHPVRVVDVMSKIILEAEQHSRQYQSPLSVPTVSRFRSEDVTESVSFTAFDLAEQIGASAIACLTASGATARAIARHRPSMPLYAFTDDPRIMRQLGMLWGTKAFSIPFQRDTDEGVNLVHGTLTEMQLVHGGDLIVITAGMPLPAKGRTNMVLVSRI